MEFLPNVIKVEDIKTEEEKITIEEEDIPMLPDDSLTTQKLSQEKIKREASADSTSPSLLMGGSKKQKTTDFMNVERIIPINEEEKGKTALQDTPTTAITADSTLPVTVTGINKREEKRQAADVCKKYEDFKSLAKKEAPRTKHSQSHTVPGGESSTPEGVTPEENEMTAAPQGTTVSNNTNIREAEDVLPEPASPSSEPQGGPSVSTQESEHSLSPKQHKIMRTAGPHVREASTLRILETQRDIQNLLADVTELLEMQTNIQRDIAASLKNLAGKI